MCERGELRSNREGGCREDGRELVKWEYGKNYGRGGMGCGKGRSKCCLHEEGWSDIFGKGQNKQS